MKTRYPTPHRPVYDPETPGCCKRCNLLNDHQVHRPEVIAAYERDQEHHREKAAEGQAWHRQRAGDRPSTVDRGERP